ncbi:urease accessory protein UreD [Roseovarius aestuariivivens]|uniref:urease accessory protein UreD n=1 Tax=Roseovarius aestuariivivens TaxID=1888910 RepID=UPI001080D317|nr:urease accessory protein UreD [Roseovarius aestuariivivens]
MLDATPYSAPRAALRQPRARGFARIEAVTGARSTRLGGLRQQGAMRVLFPRVAHGAMQAVLINTSGGLTGGDRMDIRAKAGAGAALTLTTQAAERAYRASGDAPAVMDTRLEAGAAARLHWLPQETLLFEGCHLRRRLLVEADATAEVLFCEPVIFGRAAMGEVVRDGRFDDRITLSLGGETVLLDATRMAGDLDAQLARTAVAGGARAMALIVLAGPRAAVALPHLRGLLPETAGASLVREDVLVARMLAEDGFALRATLMPALRMLAQDDLPRPWMI